MADERGTIDNTIRAIIEARVTSIWGTTSAIQYPGVDGVVDTNGVYKNEPPTDANWLRVHYEYADTDIMTIAPDSGGLNRTAGTIMLTVFTPIGRGEKALWDLVGTAKTVFDRYHNRIRCGASGAKQKLNQGGFLYVPVTTNFVFYASIS